MLLCDASVLVNAHRQESREFVRTRDWLMAAMMGPEPLAVSDEVLASFLRIVTSPRVLIDPTPAPVAIEFCERLRAAPSSQVVVPGPGRWAQFSELVVATGGSGRDVRDAFVAALAIDLGATLVTFDRGFARFPGLSWCHPFDREP